MKKHKTVFTTERGQRHQKAALDSAPDILDITMLRSPDRETLRFHLADAEYLISERVGTIDADLIEAAPNLKLIMRIGSLTYDIDTQAAKEAGIIVCARPVVSVIRVAEHMVLQMLALSKKLRETEAIALDASSEWGESKRTTEDTFAFDWSGRQDVEGLWSQTIGIIGFGEIGAELARRLQNWGCTFLYNKRRRLPESLEAELSLNYVDQDTLFRESDTVANLLPYFPETDLIINADWFAKMKDGACLVSSGSGSVINESDLAEAIKSGKLGGAALDTFEWEPIKPDNPLVALAKARYNVLLTPHIAAGSVIASKPERAKDYADIINHINGNDLIYQIT